MTDIACRLVTMRDPGAPDAAGAQQRFRQGLHHGAATRTDIETEKATNGFIAPDDRPPLR